MNSQHFKIYPICQKIVVKLIKWNLGKPQIYNYNGNTCGLVFGIEDITNNYYDNSHKRIDTINNLKRITLKLFIERTKSIYTLMYLKAKKNIKMPTF